MRVKRCSYCRKPVTMDADLWVLKDKGGKPYCSYRCLIASRHALADRDRKKMMPVQKKYTDDSLLDWLKIDREEIHSFEEWAEIFGLDYYELWERYKVCGYSIVDAMVACDSDLVEGYKGLRYHGTSHGDPSWNKRNVRRTHGRSSASGGQE